MIYNLFSKYLKLSLIVSLLPMFMGYAMEVGEEDTILGQSQELTVKMGEQINVLEQLPREILYYIMMFLPKDDSGFEYLKQYYKILHKFITSEMIELDMRHFWKQLILSSLCLEELNQKISHKSETLEKNFPNYDVLYQVYNKFVIAEQQALNEYVKNSVEASKNDILLNNFFISYDSLDQFDPENIVKNLSNEDKLIALKSMSLVLKTTRRNLMVTIAKHAVASTSWSLYVLLGNNLIGNLGLLKILYDYKSKSKFQIIGSLLAGTFLNFMSFLIIRNGIVKPVLKNSIEEIDLMLSDIEDEINNVAYQNEQNI